MCLYAKVPLFIIILNHITFGIISNHTLFFMLKINIFIKSGLPECTPYCTVTLFSCSDVFTSLANTKPDQTASAEFLFTWQYYSSKTSVLRNMLPCYKSLENYLQILIRVLVRFLFFFLVRFLCSIYQTHLVLRAYFKQMHQKWVFTFWNEKEIILYHAGFMQDSTGMKLWKKRWFVLSDLCLFYYRGEFTTTNYRIYVKHQILFRRKKLEIFLLFYYQQTDIKKLLICVICVC